MRLDEAVVLLKEIVHGKQVTASLHASLLFGAWIEYEHVRLEQVLRNELEILAAKWGCEIDRRDRVVVLR